MTDVTEAAGVPSPFEQLGAAYERFGPDERALHDRLLSMVQQPDTVAVHTEAAGDDRWTVTVCTSDWVGALATIAGLFPAYGMDIEDADAFTLRLPVAPLAALPRRGVSGPARRRARRTAVTGPAPVTRRLLDVFRVRAFIPHEATMCGSGSGWSCRSSWRCWRRDGETRPESS